MTPPADRQSAREELGAFLASRRARVTPADVGLPGGPRRRVPGLRREEVALLAQISVEYYARLERGNAGAVSEAVLRGLDQVLRLDDAERAHLRQLVRATSGERSEPGASVEGSPVAVQPVLDLLAPAAAFVRNARLDVLATNAVADALYQPVLSRAAGRNLARAVFLAPEARAFYRDWDGIADDAVGSLRAASARAPEDARLATLVADLREESPEFRDRWDGHEVRRYDAGLQRFTHPEAGDLDLAFQALDVVDQPGLTIVAYYAEPGSAAAERLGRLAENRR